MKKKLSFSLFLVLCAFLCLACNKEGTTTTGTDEPTTETPTTTEVPTTAPTEVPTTIPSSTINEEVEVLKASDNIEIAVKESRDINLKDYFKYSGTQYSYVVKTEDKGIVETELLNSSLTIYAEYKGEETVTIQLNDKSVTLTITVVGEDVLPEFDDITVSYDLNDSNSKTVTLAPDKENDYSVFSYSLKEETTGVSILDNTLTVSITEVCQKTVVIVCTLVDSKTVEFNLNINVYETVDVINGSFNDGLNGWTLNGEIGNISENEKFWNQEFPMNNVGKYFDAHLGIEANKGTLTSSLFKLSGSGYITFMLGGAGNPDCYIKIVDENDNVLAVYRNTEFRDLTPEHNKLSVEEQRELIGTEVNVCNLVKYKADLSEHIGKMIKVVVVDDATSDFGLVFFDEFVGYNEQVPGEEYTLTNNQLANFDEISGLIQNKIESQGDYTLESYNAYIEAVEAAKTAISNPYIPQSKVDELVVSINSAYAKLEVREIENKNAETQYVITENDSVSFDYNDYFDTKELSGITFEYESTLQLAVENTVLTFNAVGVELNEYTVILKALYNGEVKKTVTLTVEVIVEPTVEVKETELVYNFDLYKDNAEYTLDLAQNLIIVGDLQVTYFVNEVESQSIYNIVLTEGTHELIVQANYTYNGKNTVTYKVTLNVKDTTKYNVVNGTFDADLYGWTFEGQEFAAISENTTFWGEQYPMHNVGKYFDAYGKNDLEPNQGTLTSSSFVVGSTGYITFMLGGAGNENCFIKVVDMNGNILAIYRNTEFRDFTPEQGGLSVEAKRELIGNQVNLANLIKYKADLSAFIGQEVKLVVVDNASSGWGVIYFDELHTYYEEIPGSEYILAENQLANLDVLNELLAAEITEQGDYTLDSFTVYVNAINNAKASINNPYIKQSRVNELVNAINSAYEALAVREITVKNAETNIIVITGNEVTIDYNTYFDTANLSNVTFDYQTTLALNATANILTLNTAGLELGVYNITLNALYKNEVKKTVELTVEVSEDLTPILKETEITIKQDKYFYDKEVFELDLANNIVNSGNLVLTYKVNDLVLSGSVYTHEFDNETHDLNVEVSYEINGVKGYLVFSIDLTVVDTTPYQLYNGGFELGNLDGWRLDGEIATVSSNTRYWIGDGERPEGFEYGKDGNYLFDAYGRDGLEGNHGTLTSSTFTVGGSGYMTYKIGAAKNIDQVYVLVVNASNNETLKVLGNPLWADRTNDVKSGCTLIPYVVDLKDLMGMEVYIKVVDYASSDYGLVFLDSFITYYESKPEGFNENYANAYQVYNGDFETGTIAGWHTVNGEVPGQVLNGNNYFNGNSLNKDGNWSFQAIEIQGTGYNTEGRQGVIRSNTFILKANGKFSFKLSGGNYATQEGIRVVNAKTGEVLGQFTNDQPAALDLGEGQLVQYHYQFDNSEDLTVYIEIFDHRSEGWGLVGVDSLFVNIDSFVEGSKAANNYK